VRDTPHSTTVITRTDSRLENKFFRQNREAWWILRNVSATVANSYWTGVLLLLAAVLLLALYLLAGRCVVLLSLKNL
jgi:hypothetical protein